MLNLYLRYSKGCLSKELSSKPSTKFNKNSTANSQQPTANSQQPTAPIPSSRNRSSPHRQTWYSGSKGTMTGTSEPANAADQPLPSQRFYAGYKRNLSWTHGMTDWVPVESHLSLFRPAAIALFPVSCDGDLAPITFIASQVHCWVLTRYSSPHLHSLLPVKAHHSTTAFPCR